ncbi:hypothetical protein AcV7_003296 [Taiwanofungus camphoratus]|nr:hypothetical protein AcV7_003296 [Antrodia cinnamomea]
MFYRYTVAPQALRLGVSPLAPSHAHDLARLPVHRPRPWPRRSQQPVQLPVARLGSLCAMSERPPPAANRSPRTKALSQVSASPRPQRKARSPLRVFSSARAYLPGAHPDTFARKSISPGSMCLARPAFQTPGCLIGTCGLASDWRSSTYNIPSTDANNVTQMARLLSLSLKKIKVGLLVLNLLNVIN